MINFRKIKSDLSTKEKYNENYTKDKSKKKTKVRKKVEKIYKDKKLQKNNEDDFYGVLIFVL